jgi:hypothetical protein
VNGLRRQTERDRAVRLAPCYLRYSYVADMDEMLKKTQAGEGEGECEREMKEMMRNLEKAGSEY